MQVFYAADLGEQLSAFSGITLLKQALWLRQALQIVSARHGHQPIILLGQHRLHSRIVSISLLCIEYDYSLTFNHQCSVKHLHNVSVFQATLWAAYLLPLSQLCPNPLPPIVRRL